VNEDFGKADGGRGTQSDASEIRPDSFRFGIRNESLSMALGWYIRMHCSVYAQTRAERSFRAAGIMCHVVNDLTI
jgi:hypothetical protein